MIVRRAIGLDDRLRRWHGVSIRAARSRFDAAHELAHLVLHGEQIWGVKQIERQAHKLWASRGLGRPRLGRSPAAEAWVSTNR